jgi:hypothetical protein
MTDKVKTTLKLSDLEMKVLLEILNFAGTAALVVKNLETDRKSDQKDIDRMAGVVADAKELIKIITNQAIKPEERPEFLN